MVPARTGCALAGRIWRRPGHPGGRHCNRQTANLRELVRRLVQRPLIVSGEPGAPARPDGRDESVSQPVCRPSGTRRCSTFLPGTYVPGFPMSPLRGWSSGVFHFLAVLGVATQTRGRPSLRFLGLNRSHIAPHPLFYMHLIMATPTRNTSGGASPAIIENYERERVFGLFRQFGYLEAELNPLGLLPPQPHPDLRFEASNDNNNDNEWA